MNMNMSSRLAVVWVCLRASSISQHNHNTTIRGDTATRKASTLPIKFIERFHWGWRINDEVTKTKPHLKGVSASSPICHCVPHSETYTQFSPEFHMILKETPKSRANLKVKKVCVRIL